jgi:hypothetical protein
MYSPHIRDDLIPLLYRLARQEGKPMTRLVDEILRAEVERRLQVVDQQSIPDLSESLKPKKNS